VAIKKFHREGAAREKEFNDEVMFIISSDTSMMALANVRALSISF
jgi:hypothetical protein